MTGAGGSSMPPHTRPRLRVPRFTRPHAGGSILGGSGNKREIVRYLVTALTQLDPSSAANVLERLTNPAGRRGQSPFCYADHRVDGARAKRGQSPPDLLRALTR